MFDHNHWDIFSENSSLIERSTIITNSQDDTSGASVVEALGIVASLLKAEARMFYDYLLVDWF